MVTRFAPRLDFARNWAGVKMFGYVGQFVAGVQVKVVVRSAPLMPWIGEASRMSGMYSKNMPVPPRRTERPLPKTSYAKDRRGAMLFLSSLIWLRNSGCCGKAFDGGRGVAS